MKRVGRMVVFGLVALVTIVGLTYAGINFWGRHEWNAAKKELLARGEPLSLAELLPPEIPDDANFFATPSWREIKALDADFKNHLVDAEEYRKRDPFEILQMRDASGNKRPAGRLGRRGGHLFRPDALTDFPSVAEAFRERGVVTAEEASPPATVLAGLERMAPLLAEIEAAARRPGARFPSEMNPENPFETPMPQMVPCLSLAQTLDLRAVARMAAGDVPGAKNDILLILRIARSLQAEPFLITKLVEASCQSIAATTFWECNAIGTWSESDLEEMQKAFAQCHPLTEMIAGLRSDRGAFNQWLSRPPKRDELIRIVALAQGMVPEGETRHLVSPAFLRFCPEGILLADQASFNRAMQERIATLQTGDPKAISRLPNAGFGVTGPWIHPISSVSSIDFRSLAERALDNQSIFNLAQIACALERYYLRQGVFPASLSALEPDLMAAIPLDPTTGKPIIYEPRPPEGYRLICGAVHVENGRPAGGKFVWNRRPETPSPQ